jgi:putative hydrolase of the HAD superfamily
VLRAVVLDYRHTLADFEWDDGRWLRGVRALVEAAGGDAADAVAAAEGLRRRFDRRDPGDLAELDYPRAVSEVLGGLGLAADGEVVRRAIAAEHRVWEGATRLRPGALGLLDGVRARGLRVGVVANTFDPPELFRGDLRALGIAPRTDAIVLSCEVGMRMPHPAVYRAALAALGAAAADSLLATAAAGPRASVPAGLGVRTVAAGTEPLQLLRLVEGIVESGSAGKI